MFNDESCVRLFHPHRILLISQMTSVERIMDYIKIQPEAEVKSREDKQPADTWPSAGQIESHSVSMKYSITSPYILNNIKFIIHPREKVRYYYI